MLEWDDDIMSLFDITLKCSLTIFLYLPCWQGPFKSRTGQTLVKSVWMRGEVWMESPPQPETRHAVDETMCLLEVSQKTH